tara:strand:- start:816 stop:1025 length:210 start_codon:yes stop_codon:yes gene_type:complete
MVAFVVHYNTQRCIGYSADFEKTYLLCDVRYNDGTTKTIVEERQGGRLPVKMSSGFLPAIALPDISCTE